MDRLVRVPPGYPIAQPGDTWFGSGTGGMAPLVKWATRSAGEAATFASHQGGVTRPGYLVPPPDGRAHALAWVSESQFKVVEREFWAAYSAASGYRVAVYRPRNLNDLAVEAIVKDWRSRTGKLYGGWHLLSYLGKKLTGIPFEKLHRGWLRVCSEHAAKGYTAAAHLAQAYARVNVGFGKRAEEVTPDDAIDYCNDHRDEWQLVGWAVVP